MMGSVVRQCTALISMNLKSVPRRFWISLSMVVSIAMVVAVLLGFLSMANGFQKTLQNAGSPDIVIALGTGAATELGSRIEPSQIDFLSAFNGLKHNAAGDPIISEELVVPVDAVERSSGLAATLALRGIGVAGLDLRPKVKIVEGRVFAPGAAELIVGRRLSNDYLNLKVGNKIAFGSTTWTVTGVFGSDGSAFESEMYADGDVVRSTFNRPGLVQSIRAAIVSPDQLGPLSDFSTKNSQVALNIRSETQFFSSMAERTTRLILFIGWPLAFVMAIGAVVGALTTMYSSVSDRLGEIATVRALGFNRSAAFVGTWIEAIVLTLVGCILGATAVYLILDGWAASTTSGDQMQIGFRLSVTWPLIIQAVCLALLVGALGGALPAYRATRIPLRVAMTGRE